MVDELTIEPGYLRRLIFKMRATSLGDEDTPRDARDNAQTGGHHITLAEEVDTDATHEEFGRGNRRYGPRASIRIGRAHVGRAW